MATVSPEPFEERPNEHRVHRWQGIARSPPRLAAEIIMHSKGSFGGVAVTFEGSTDDVAASFVGLRDPQGALISMAAKEYSSGLPDLDRE